MLTETQKDYAREYYQQNKEKLQEYGRKYRLEYREEINSKRRTTGYRIKARKYLPRKKAWRKEFAVKVFSYYSDGVPQCNLCGESDFDVLCIDHVNGGGERHRRELGLRGGFKFYQWLERNDYPSGFQVLCSNCNIKKMKRGM